MKFYKDSDKNSEILKFIEYLCCMLAALKPIKPEVQSLKAWMLELSNLFVATRPRTDTCTFYHDPLNIMYRFYVRAQLIRRFVGYGVASIALLIMDNVVGYDALYRWFDWGPYNASVSTASTGLTLMFIIISTGTLSTLPSYSHTQEELDTLRDFLEVLYIIGIRRGRLPSGETYMNKSETVLYFLATIANRAQASGEKGLGTEAGKFRSMFDAYLRLFKKIKFVTSEVTFDSVVAMALSVPDAVNEPFGN